MGDELYGSHKEACEWSFKKLRDMGITNILGIEFGSGYYSTQMFHDNCPTLLTIETELDWMNKFVHLESPTHRFLHITRDSWVETLSTMDLTCDVALVDSFDGPSRSVVMEHIRDCCKLVVVHDQENVFRNPGACYQGQIEAVRSFEYCRQFPFGSIVTAVLSNSINVEE